MKAQIFSLAAGQQLGQAPEFTKKERDSLLELARVAIEVGAVRDYLFSENGKRRELHLINGKWEGAPGIRFAKMSGQHGISYFYNREGGDHVSTGDFERALSAARSDLVSFGQQVQAEQLRSASNTAAARRRSQFAVIKSP